MKQIYILITVLIALILASCSDEDFIRPQNKSCLLNAYTDSNSYFFDIEYVDNLVVKRTNYRLDENGEKELVNITEIKRNFFSEIIAVLHYDKDNVLTVVDSIYRDDNGLIYEFLTFNEKGESFEREKLYYNSDELVEKSEVYKFESKWVLKNSRVYEYDSEGRVSKSTYEVITKTGSNKDITYFTYDLQKNIDIIADPFTLFKKNNILTSKSEYTLSDGSKVTETKIYDHIYNDEGYPIETKITSLANPNDVKYKYNIIDCK